MIQLDLKSGVPICDQIVNGFIRLRALGALGADEQMPSVRSLASSLSVNPNTIQKAYGLLEAKGIIYSVKGRGSFISGDNAAENAVRKAAELQLSEAIKGALELGLCRRDIEEIVDDICKKEGQINDKH